jgi:hypothetical protein
LYVVHVLSSLIIRQGKYKSSLRCLHNMRIV